MDSVLGEGGMGTVWAAFDVREEVEVGIKLIKSDAASGEARKRFLREARAVMAVHHPNVVAVREVVEVDGEAPALVMELLHGEPLSEKLKRDKTLSAAEVATIFLPVISAVGTAHALGIIHRDLKPQNIFLAREEDGATTVKVLDFGVAKLTARAGDAAQSSGLTATGMLLGTPAYMAPEQAFGETDLDHRVDVWALGIVLYQCLSGVLPTDGDNLGQILKLVLSRAIKPLAEVAPSVPSELAAMVDRMLQRRRSERLGDLHEVLAVLARFTDVEVPLYGPSLVPLAEVNAEDDDSKAVMALETLGSFGSSDTEHAQANTPVNAKSLKVGDVVGPYRVEGELGRGGMGVVYGAFDERLHRRVAIKVVAPSLVDDPGARGRFLKEARAAARLEHVNVGAVYEVREENGALLLVMPLYEGETLKELIAKGPMEPARVEELLSQLLAGLAKAHAAGIVHRDLKPANVFVTREGVLKILDFGLATIEVEGEGVGSTSGHGLAGTLAYMAPEQLRGEGADARSDLWAVGIIAYEMLAGAHPFGPLQPTTALVERIIDQDIPKPPANATERLRTLLSRLTAKTPGDRLRDAVAAEISFGSRLVQKADSTNARPMRLRTKLLGIAAVSLLAAVGVWATLHTASSSGGANSPVVAASADTSRAIPLEPRAMTAFPPPASSSPEALAEYAAGLRAYRDGAYLLAVRKLERAIELDDALGAAHVRFAAWSFSDPALARRHLETARGLRASMSERDRALFEGLDRCMGRESVLPVSCMTAVRDWEDRFPLDAELHMLASQVLNTLDLDAAGRSAEHAVDADPDFAQAWVNVGWARAYAGRLDWEAFDRILAISPGATEGLWVRIQVREEHGDCTGALSDAQRAIRVAPDDGVGYRSLARALAATGASFGSTEEALRQAAVRGERGYALGTTDTTTLVATDRIGLLLLGGDFAGAIAIADQMDRAPGAGEVEHAFAARTQIDAWLELGDAARATKRAREFEERRAGWARDLLMDDWAITRDPTPLLLTAARRGDSLGVADLRHRRDAWIDDWKKRTTPYWSRWLWPAGYATLVETEDDAREALAALGPEAKIPPFMPDTLLTSYVGHTYQLAGRNDEALPYLEKATRSCYALPRAIEHTRAHLWLGQVLEKKGDTEGACRAYGVVAERWGARAQKSKTLAAARSRIAALRCARPAQ